MLLTVRCKCKRTKPVIGQNDPQLPFDLLPDVNKDVSQAYDTCYEPFTMNLTGVGKWSAFAID